VEINL